MRSRASIACASLAALAIAAGEGDSRAAGRDWIGSARCGSCHPAELAAWRATPHAKVSFAVPAALRLPGTAVCLTCHATGEQPAGLLVEPAVGCEACHGAGADYAADDIMRNPRLAADLGLVELRAPAVRAALCAGCHRAVAMRPGADLRAAAHPALAAPVAPVVPAPSSSPASPSPSSSPSSPSSPSSSKEPSP